MKYFKLFFIVTVICMLITITMVGCNTSDNANKEPVEPSIDVPEIEPDPIDPGNLDLLPGPDGYAMIDMKNAESYMASKDNYIILDVRRIDEFSEGHIPNAINIPNEEIGTDEITELPDKNALIFVYCRSGNRSKDAAKKLATLGYSRVVEIGGILDWTGDIVVEKEETPELILKFRIPQPDVLTYKFKFPPLGRKH
jgi:rhodanese-related sulfurtransferase